MVKTFKGWGENERLQCSEYKKISFETFHRCTRVHSGFIYGNVFKNETVKLVLVGGSGDFGY